MAAGRTPSVDIDIDPKSNVVSGFVPDLGDKASARLFNEWMLLTVDMEENLEWVADCNEDVKEDRLLLLSENLCRGEVGVVSICDS